MSYHIEIDDVKLDSLIRIIDEKVSSIKLNKELPGAYLIGTFDFCPFNKGEIYFIEYITHPIGLEKYRIIGYSKIDELLLLHYNQSVITNSPQFNGADLNKVVQFYLYDMNQIPESGSDEYYIYNSKKNINEVFNYRDTLETYGSKEMERKLGEYVDFYCYD